MSIDCQNGSLLKRREFLKCCAGLGLYSPLALAANVNGGGLLPAEQTHFEPRARHLIFVFLTGGMSHVDTFDFKPRLRRDHGRVVPSVDLRGTSRQPLLGSPFRFLQHGQSGLWISELFPHLATVADDLCIIRTLCTDIVEHFQAVLAMHTGSATVPMPSLGSWLSYGLGTRNPNLPPYMVLAEHLPYAGAQVWDSSFLPPVHQGVRLLPGPSPIPDLHAPTPSVTLQELEQVLLRDVNEMHAQLRPGDLDLRARMQSFDIARGMMRQAPEIFDLSRETESTRRAYGVQAGDNTSFAWQCLIARRLIERGVRTVELIDTGASHNWDAHGNMEDHRPKARRVDQALAALIKDLKQRGLFQETLIACCTEFGRTPWTDAPGTRGRNHYARAFSCFLAGAGVRGGMAYGQTDEYGIDIVADRCHVHDLHATLLHLMGIDHRRLTYRYAGRDFRLTDVHGNVVQSILT
jgi:hypothetical protein